MTSFLDLHNCIIKNSYKKYFHGDLQDLSYSCPDIYKQQHKNPFFLRKLPGLFDPLLRQSKCAVGRDILGFFSFDFSSYKETGKSMKGSSEIEKEVCSNLNFRR